MGSKLRNDDRAVSEAFSYILVLFTTIVFAGVVFSAFSIVGGAADHQIADQMDTEGQRMKGTIEKVDRRVRASSSSGPIGIHLSLSKRMGNNQYEVGVIQETGVNGDQYLRFQTLTGDFTTRIEVESETRLENASVEGGNIYIVREPGESTIRVVSEE